MESTAPQSNLPVFAQFSSENLVLGAGVAIFHVKTGRVVICSADDRYGRRYYFLPKGRRDAGEESGTGAEREGYEEVRVILVLFETHYQPSTTCTNA